MGCSDTRSDMWLSTLAEICRQVTRDRHDDACGEPWPQHQWFQCFKVLVYDMPESEISGTKDDLVFFISLSHRRDVMTRRKTKTQPLFEDTVDWKASVILYVIMHTEYHCTMTCDTIVPQSRSSDMSQRSQGDVTSHGNACLALPHMDLSCNSGLVFDVRDVMAPLHVGKPDGRTLNMVFTLQADLTSSWIPNACKIHDTGDTQHMVTLSSGAVPVDQLHAAHGWGASTSVVPHSSVRTFIDTMVRNISGDRRTSGSTSPDGMVLELVDPTQTAVYTISLSSSDVIRVCDVRVMDFDGFASSLCRALYRRLE